MTDDPIPSPRDRASLEPPMTEVRVEVAHTDYPSEVTCRQCGLLMLPDDPSGRSWSCYACLRRVVVALSPA
ncbi:MAG: hypothetical protein HMLKMBBP_00971 [Planctomycetes bacterium]|nr:hypothetical protein [Planctomycetota bacterium]